MKESNYIEFHIVFFLAILVNTPLYLVYSLSEIPIEDAEPFSSWILFASAVFMVLLSIYFLRNFSTGFNVINGLLFGLSFSILTFVLDFLFFGWFMGHGSNFLRLFIALIYIEWIILSPVVGYIGSRIRK